MNKWGVQRLFETMQIVPKTRTTLQVTSTLLWIFREKIWLGLKKSKNVAKTAKIEGYIIHAFRLFWGLSSERHGMPPRTMGGHWKGVIWVGTNIWMPLRSFQGYFGFHEKWINEVVSKGFPGQCKWCQAHAQFCKSRQHSKNSKNVAKTAKIEGYNTCFRTFLGPGSEHYGMPPSEMRGHWKWVMWLETNIWMPLRSFRSNFGFLEKWTNRVFRTFRDNANCAKHTNNVRSLVGTPTNVSRVNMTRTGEVQKYPKNSQNWRL